MKKLFVFIILILLTDNLLAKNNDYVDVCGVKWARGNLIYQDGQWSLASSQWFYFDYVDGKESVQKIHLPNEGYDHFNWGVCGKNALSKERYAQTDTVDICGKMYLDSYCEQQTDDFEKAQFGDLAYWATIGRYRLPTYQEMLTLLDKASFQYGYYLSPDNKRVFGYLFFTPKGRRVKNYQARRIKDDDLEKGLFLPAVGYMQNKNVVTGIIFMRGQDGHYWTSRPYHPVKYQAYRLFFYEVGLFLYEYDNDFAKAIRPVLNE